MDIVLLLKSIVGLVSILAILIILLFLTSSKKKKKVTVLSPKKVVTSVKTPLNTDLASLIKVIKNKKSTTKELQEALDLVIKYHGTVHKKLGLSAHRDFDTYMDILFTICRHPNTSKDVVLKFDRELERLNPEYKQEINESITKGLNSRRV
ncbi:MAG: hypothetical protein ACJAWW_000720 [Sulfurimonas sp.]|jgi:hypothetical protein